MKRALLSILALIALGCGTKTETKTERGTAVDHGKFLFADRSASPSTTNKLACATCHPTEDAPSNDRVFTGASLAGATVRPTFWGGQRNDLLESINDCRFYFMDAKTPWTRDDEEAKALYAYLASLPARAPGPTPFTVVRTAVDLPAGDSQRGSKTFDRACRTCHGAPHTGDGRITSLAPRLPDETIKEHGPPQYSATDRRLVFIEKVRHGGFLGYGGNMAPFSVEALSDQDLSDLLAFFGVY